VKFIVFFVEKVAIFAKFCWTLQILQIFRNIAKVLNFITSSEICEFVGVVKSCDIFAKLCNRNFARSLITMWLNVWSLMDSAGFFFLLCSIKNTTVLQGQMCQFKYGPYGTVFPHIYWFEPFQLKSWGRMILIALSPLPRPSIAEWIGVICHSGMGVGEAMRVKAGIYVEVELFFLQNLTILFLLIFV